MHDIEELNDALARCHEAREAAIPHIREFLRRRVWVVLRTWGSGRFDATQREELAQTALANVLQAFDAFAVPRHGDRRLLAELRSVTRKAVEEYLGRQTNITVDDGDHPASPGLVVLPDFDERAARGAMNELDLEALERLETGEALTLLLASAGLTATEIAKARGVAVSTITRRLDRAKRAYAAKKEKVDG